MRRPNDSSRSYALLTSMPTFLQFSICEKYLFFYQDANGSELYTLNSLSLRDGRVQALIPPCTNPHIVYQTSSAIFISANFRDSITNDLVVCSLANAKYDLVHNGSPTTSGYRILSEDGSFYSLETSSTSKLSRILRYRQGTIIHVIDLENLLGASVLAIDNKLSAYIGLIQTSPEGTNFYIIDTNSDGPQLIASSHYVFSPNELFLDCSRSAVIAGLVEAVRPEWILLSTTHQALIDQCTQVAGPGFFLSSASRSLNTIVISSTEPQRIPSTYVVRHDSFTHDAFELRHSCNEHNNFVPFPMTTVQIETPDGLSLIGYLTKAVHTDASYNPLIVLVHGGPHERDHYVYRRDHQFFAAHGFSVLSVNFRGSAGFGDKFEAAGYREWGGKMQEDLDVSIKWAVENGHAISNQVGMMGASYGGYATLMSASGRKNISAAIALNPVVDLVDFLLNTPPHWAPFSEWIKMSIGDLDDPSDRERLSIRSPISHVQKLDVPLMIIHGTNDSRITGTSIVNYSALANLYAPSFSYIQFDDGHNLGNSSHQVKIYASCVDFFKKHIPREA